MAAPIPAGRADAKRAYLAIKALDERIFGDALARAPAAAARRRVDGMKRLASRSTWWHTLPHKS